MSRVFSLIKLLYYGTFKVKVLCCCSKPQARHETVETESKHQYFHMYNKENLIFYQSWDFLKQQTWKVPGASKTCCCYLTCLFLLFYCYDSGTLNQNLIKTLLITRFGENVRKDTTPQKCDDFGTWTVSTNNLKSLTPWETGLLKAWTHDLWRLLKVHLHPELYKQSLNQSAQPINRIWINKYK